MHAPLRRSHFPAVVVRIWSRQGMMMLTEYIILMEGLLSLPFPVHGWYYSVATHVTINHCGTSRRMWQSSNLLHKRPFRRNSVLKKRQVFRRMIDPSPETGCQKLGLERYKQRNKINQTRHWTRQNIKCNPAFLTMSRKSMLTKALRSRSISMQNPASQMWKPILIDDLLGIMPIHEEKVNQESNRVLTPIQSSTSDNPRKKTPTYQRLNRSHTID